VVWLRRVLDLPLVIGALWAAALAVAALLAYQRYLNATVSPTDFGIFFRAGRAVAHGHSPYSASGYVYPPLVALVLAPFSHLPELSVFRVWLIVSIACLGVTAACVVWMEARRLSRWQLPVLFGFCSVTAFHFWPLVIELPDGQSDVFTLTVLTVSYVTLIRGRAVASGIMVGIAGLIKGWPALVALVFLQRGRPRRRQSLVAFVVVLAVAPITALLVVGASGPANMVSAIVDARSQPRLASYSVWGIPHLSFSHTLIGHPLIVSPVLVVVATVVLLAWVVALVALTLRQAHPDPSIPFWNVVFCVILLLPVSHLTYTMYALPVLWLWSARAARTSRVVSADSVVLAVLFLWWLVVSQSALGEDVSQTSATVVFFADLLACSASVVGMAVIDARQAGTVLPKVLRRVPVECASPGPSGSVLPAGRPPSVTGS
jgi:hypothetical protein